MRDAVSNFYRQDKPDEKGSLQWLTQWAKKHLVNSVEEKKRLNFLHFDCGEGVRQL